ncbi:MAG: SDR family NAD(P)-dependent oxidoreductase, partial [Flavisolibacter sp.]|nr:SDR family NAD(P)-dependent oxidoreductase [Flavisolibacter sp.]
MRFTDKVCLVTGAGSGIGRATIERMAAEGGLAVVIDRDEKGGNATVANITQAGGTAIFSKCDVGNEDEIKSSVQMALDKWGRIDVVVNNAAMMTFKRVVDLTAEEWDTVMR